MPRKGEYTEEALDEWTRQKIQQGEKPCFGCKEKVGCIFIMYNNKRGCSYRKRWMLMIVGAAEDRLLNDDPSFSIEAVMSGLANLTKELELE